MTEALHIVTSLFAEEGASCLPEHIGQALRKHFSSPSVASVQILTEPDPALVESLCKPLNGHEKCSVTECNERPSFALLFETASKLIEREGGMVAIVNSDISFADEEAIQRCLSSLRGVMDRNPSSVFALTRHDVDQSAWKISLYENSGFPNYLSADCWVFGTRIELPAADHYCLGQMNCDTMVNYDLMDSGFHLLNPCFDIAIHHHENDLKELDYYVGESRKEENQKKLWEFVSSRGIPDYSLVGIPWIRSTWLETGYLPKPFCIRTRKMIVSLPESVTTAHLEGLQAASDFAAKWNYDLVLASDGDPDATFQAVQAIIGTIRNSCLFQPQGGVDRFSKKILEDGFMDNPSLALCSSPELLGERLSENVDVIMVDLSVPDLETQAKTKNQAAKCSLISSVFRSDDFLEPFLANCMELEGYDTEIEHLLLFSRTSETEREALLTHTQSHSNCLLIWHREDPGLYECWNTGVWLARTPFVSNANVDDLRHPSHVRRLVGLLEENPTASVAAAAIGSFEIYPADVDSIEISESWYSDRGGSFGFQDLYHLQPGHSGEMRMESHNMPHCMPVWRTRLHDSHGFFKESSYGTYADWEFWLRIMKAGESGVLLPELLAYYFVNPDSHNHRGDKLAELHRKVTEAYLPYALAMDSAMQGGWNIYERKLNLFGRSTYFGAHRNSFNSIVDCLEPLHAGENGIAFYPFLERYFVWGEDSGEAGSKDPRPILQPWIGILHVPFDSPVWFQERVHPESFFQTELWKESMRHCKGIICLSEDLRRDLTFHYPELPIIAIKHPTAPCQRGFDFDVYLSKPRLVQVGDWMRQLQAIYRIKSHDHEKLMLMKEFTRDFMNEEINALGDFRNDTVRQLDFVGNEEYDDLLSSSVILCMLHATAANNLVLECIARATPLIINPLPSVIEYLGEDYPLYASSIREAEILLLESGKIQDANLALRRRRCQLDLSYSAFMNTFASSEFYANLRL